MTKEGRNEGSEQASEWYLELELKALEALLLLLGALVFFSECVNLSEEALYLGAHLLLVLHNLLRLRCNRLQVLL